MCGAPVHKPVYYEVEGTVMILCNRCARYGKRVHRPVERKSVSSGKIRPKKTIRSEVIDWELADDYGQRIRRARERLGMSQEELSRLIGEPLSYVKKIEKQKVYPSEAVINRIERVLGIKLKSSIIELSALENEQVLIKREKGSETGTKLGDILVFRKDKKKSKRK